GKTAEEVLEIKKAEPIEDKYALSYILAGNWRMAMIWIEEDPFITPKQLTEIAVKNMRGM
ncbi:MAG: hypothetical protein KBS66_03165, partial [Eubacterium sp.]|nr:hypothetical protein [Candidatus Colimonas fimequi]